MTCRSRFSAATTYRTTVSLSKAFSAILGSHVDLADWVADRVSFPN